MFDAARKERVMHRTHGDRFLDRQRVRTSLVALATVGVGLWSSCRSAPQDRLPSASGDQRVDATAGAALTDPACGTAVPPLGSCHPTACTPDFCARGDVVS